MDHRKISRNVAKLPGVELFYYDTKTEGPAILCIHGRCGRGETWYDFMQRYGERYRVIAPDQRGHGLSGRPDSGYTDRRMAEDMIELMDALNIPPPFWSGIRWAAPSRGIWQRYIPNVSRPPRFSTNRLPGQPCPRRPIRLRTIIPQRTGRCRSPRAERQWISSGRCPAPNWNISSFRTV